MPACCSLARIGIQRAGFPLRAGLTRYFMRRPGDALYDAPHYVTQTPRVTERLSDPRRVQAFPENQTEIVSRHRDRLVAHESDRCAQRYHRFHVAHAPRGVAAAQLLIERLVAPRGLRATAFVRAVQIQDTAIDQSAPPAGQ